MIVGRAVNGWGNIKATSAESFSENAIKRFEYDHFDWIACENGVLRNNELEDGKYYWLNDSPFWRANRKIWMGITGNLDFVDSEQDRWVDYIAWTNLYKIAPKLTGNPTTAMKKKQLEACKKILKSEIEILKPTHILFVTGYYWWFEDFKDFYDIEFSDIKQNEYRSDKKNENFAETSATTKDGIKVVVACRPEFRDETLYVEDVIKSLKPENKAHR